MMRNAVHRQETWIFIVSTAIYYVEKTIAIEAAKPQLLRSDKLRVIYCLLL
ncbi:MAG: hypothetical protein LBU61_06730 [Coriobacteriales bacterium]|nr:hypothetical protein [Coriobacteriales bacterium]